MYKKQAVIIAHTKTETVGKIAMQGYSSDLGVNRLNI